MSFRTFLYINITIVVITISIVTTVVTKELLTLYNITQVYSMECSESIVIVPEEELEI